MVKVPKRSTRESVALVPRLSTVSRRRTIISPPNQATTNAAQMSSLASAGKKPLPRNGPALTNWVLSHFPIALSIVAAGAAIVSLIGHAHVARAPAETAWLLSGAVALGLLALIVVEQSLVDAARLFSVYRPLRMALAVGAVVALVVGWLRPAPWLLALLLVADLSLLWAFAVLRFLSADAWDDERPMADLARPQPAGVVPSKAEENR